MDSFTQDMLDRAKQRREMLAQKMGDLSPRKSAVDLTPSRKRSSPLRESTNTNDSQPLERDDSFQKRQRFLKEEEKDVSPISTTRSRVVGLAALRKTRTEEKMETENSHTTSSVSSTSSSTYQTTTTTTPSRKSRLAALASHINNWEDDLSRPTIKKDEPVRKVWQPPKPLTDDSPAKPPRKSQASPIKNRTASPFKSPVKSEPAVKSSPNVRRDESPKKHSSSITIQLSANKEETEKDLLFVPGRTTQPSPAKETASPSSKLKFIPGRTSELTPSSFVGKGASKGSPVSKPSEDVHKAVSSRVSQWQSSKRSTPSKEEELTQKPVGDRLSLWQKRVNEAESETQKGNAVDIKPGFSNKTPSKVKPTTEKTAAVDHIFEKIKTPQPQKITRPSPAKSPYKSPSNSPRKDVGGGTKSIHDRLTSLQDGWKKNQIAEKAHQQREAELAQLQNRWKQDPKASEVTGPPASASSSAVQKPVETQAPKTPKEKRRENARDKIRNDFENKLQAMGFELNGEPIEEGKVASFDLTPIKQREKAERERLKNQTKSASPVKPVNQTPKASAPPVNNYTPAATPGRSIFGLIKSTPGTPQSASQQAMSRNSPVVTRTPNKQVDDSFEDSFEDEPVQPSPRRSVHFERPDSSQSEYTDTADTASTYSEDQTETSSPNDHSEGEDIYESQDYTENSSGSEYSDEEYGDGQGNISELLDEALDTTEMMEVEELPKPAPRKNKSSSSSKLQTVHKAEYRHDNSTGFRATTQVTVQSNSRPNRVDVTMATKMKDVPSTSAARSSSSSDDNREVVYSIDAYRQTKSAKKSTPNPKMIIVRHSQASPRKESMREEKLPYIPEQDVKKKLRELQELVNQEQTVIMQTSKALNNCCSSGSAFHGSSEAVECHKVLLMACKKREAYLTEMQKLREKPMNVTGAPKGSLTISDIRLPLKSDYSTRLNNEHRRTVHYFVVMVRNGAHVIFTQMVSTRDSLSRGCIDIPNLIKLNDITEDFSIELQVYGMSITQEEMTPKKKRGLTPKKKTLKSALSHLQSPGGPFAVHTTNFTHIASLTINKRSLDKSHFSLERIPFSSPLNGSIHLRMRCLMEVRINRRGFLTMFEDVSGFGAWHRRWFSLAGNTLSYWKYPDDEKHKEPMGVLDLKSCITDCVDIISRDICARPNSFELLTVRRQHRGEADTLVQKVYNTMTTRKNWLAADTKEERISWCHTLNEALSNLRMWHSDAMRPIKRANVESTM